MVNILNFLIFHIFTQYFSSCSEMPKNPAVLQAPEPLVQKRNGRSTKFSSLITPTPAAIMSSSKERARPSGYQKKARTISSTKFLQVTSGGAGAEVVEMGSSSQPKPTDSNTAAGRGSAAAAWWRPATRTPAHPPDPGARRASRMLRPCLHHRAPGGLRRGKAWMFPQYCHENSKALGLLFCIREFVCLFMFVGYVH